MAYPVTEATEPAAPAPAPAPAKRPRRRLWAALAIALALVAGAVAYEVTRTHPGGDELRLDPAYGWFAAKEVGTIFTDGMTVIPLTSQRRGPLRLISARPLMDDGTALRVVGVLARVLPDMAPAGTLAVVQDSPGFPSREPQTAGAVAVAGLVVPASTFDTNRSLQLQIGYEVVGPGRSARLGVELIYEHGGFRHRAVVPSHLTICAPAAVACADPQAQAG